MTAEKEKPKPKNSAKKWGIVIITVAGIIAVTVMSMRGC
jgi:hypothetical protein